MDFTFNEGDKVIVRQWDDMLAQFGWVPGRRGESINAAAHFVSGMREFCGRTFTISRLDKRGDGKYNVYGHSWSCTISTDMIMPYKIPQKKRITL